MTDKLREALEACRIIDAAVKEGHDNVSDLLMHLLEAAVPARAALAAAPQPAPVDREAMVEVIRLIRLQTKCSLDDARNTLDALLARGLRLPERVTETPESEHDAGNVLTPAAERRSRQMRIFPDASRVVEGGDDAA